MKTFFEGNRVRYVGRVWYELVDVGGTVLFEKERGKGYSAYRVKFDKKTDAGWDELTVLSDNLELVEEKTSPDRAQFEGGGVRDGSKKTERFELTWTLDDSYEDQMLTRYAAWMARGADKYEDRNWEQFQGPDALEHAKGSLLRHVFKFLAEMEDEDHAAAVWFNIQAIDRIRRKMKG